MQPQRLLLLAALIAAAGAALATAGSEVGGAPAGP